MTIDAAAEAADTTPINDDADLEASLDAIRAAAPPEATAQQQTPATGQPAAQQPDAMVLPDDEEQRLVEHARKRAAERSAREPLEQMQRKLTDLESMLARAPGVASLMQAVQAKDPAALASAFKSLGLDPSAVQQLATRAQLAPSPADQIRAVVKEELGPLLELVKPRQQAAAPQQYTPEQRAETLGAYESYVDAVAERFPLQAAMGPYLGEAVAKYLRETFIAQGMPSEEIDLWPMEKTATLFERHLASRAKRSQPSGAPTIASGEPTPPSSGTSTASGGPTKSTSAPRSITNGQVADAGRRLPRTSREIDDELAKELDEIKRKATG